MSDDRGRPAPPPGMTEAILRATSGPACASAEPRLCDFVDGGLEAVDRELVARHLTGCTGCAALVRALRFMGSNLPLLAEMDPGLGFVESVTALTVNAATRRMTIGERLTRLADDWLQRPRIAFESAYVGAFVLMLLFGTPLSPLSGLPREALAAASANPVAGIREPISRVSDRIAVEVQDAWEATRETAGATSIKVADKMAGKPGSILRRWVQGISERLFPSETTEPAAGAGRHEDLEHDDNGVGSPDEVSRPDGV